MRKQYVPVPLGLIESKYDTDNNMTCNYTEMSVYDKQGESWETEV